MELIRLSDNSFSLSKAVSFSAESEKNEVGMKGCLVLKSLQKCRLAMVKDLILSPVMMKRIVK